MNGITKISAAIVLVALSMVVGVASVKGDSSTPSTPPNYVGVSFSPTVSTVSYNYDFLTGTLSPGTATMTFLSVDSVAFSVISDPSPPDPSGSGTFTGTAQPFHYNGDQVVYEQSIGFTTFGGFVMRNVHGDTLDQVTNLQAMWLAQSGVDGGGAPRFQIDMSDGHNIFVYFGHYPAFGGESPSTFTPACPTDQCGTTHNMASDSAGLRWDSSKIGGTFYGTYSEAVSLANAQGLTIVSISVITDGGWSTGNAGPNGQTFLFKDIQVNTTTRFP